MGNENESIKSLETRITHLEKHLEEQDAEIYQLSKRINTLVKVAREQKAQLTAMNEMSSGRPSDSPADEKPPHY